MTTQNVYAPAPLSWRKITPLHKRMGAHSLRIPLVLSANTPLTIFQATFGAGTIDRIIGCRLGLGGVGAGTVTLKEIHSGWQIAIVAATQLGDYGFNIETLIDGANLTIESSVDVDFAKGAMISLFNFELPPYQIGHS